MRRATPRRGKQRNKPDYFYPRSPCGERPMTGWGAHDLVVFLSTLSLRRATYNRKTAPGRPQNFYPRSPCGERRHNPGERHPGFGISIHALLAESDLPNSLAWVLARLFLSTLSLRRATTRPNRRLPTQRHFYPRSPCGERRVGLVLAYNNCEISIHALLAESDGASVWSMGV